MKKNGVGFTNLKGTAMQRLRAARGLGDVVAVVAQPVAKFSDAVLGTKLAGCGSCTQRQEALNERFPINR